MILKVFSHALGPKGLIRGQYLDLSEEVSSFKSLLKTHELKTARLIQIALIGGGLLSNNISYRKIINLAKLGYSIGIIFQLFDDLDDAQSDREDSNTWKHNKDIFKETIKIHLEKTQKILKSEQLNLLKNFIESYISTRLHLINESS